MPWINHGTSTSLCEMSTRPNKVSVYLNHREKMYLLKKFKQQGAKWVIRRALRELISPSTKLGQKFKFLSPIIYKTINASHKVFRSSRTTNKLSNDTLYFFYDFDIEPITYDFAWALCLANAKREELGLRILHINFVPGTKNGLRYEAPDYEKIIGVEARRWRVHSILVPMIQLLRCQYGVTLCANRKEAAQINKQAQFVYPTNYHVNIPIPYIPKEAMDYGQKFMALHAEEKAKKYILDWLDSQIKNKKLLVITLRQYAYTPERNSNLLAWAQFANAIDKDKFFIVFVPDTERAMLEEPEELKGFRFFLPACWNLNLRAALYELAYINLGVNTGPMSLCWLNPKCRYISFKTAVKNLPHIPLEMLTNKGFVPGKDPVFAGKYQKWVWDDDEFEIILSEFKSMCNALNQN